MDPNDLREYLDGIALDKKRTGEGPWKHEPDRVEFRHAGLPCLLNRAPILAWCGYVGLPPGHPARGDRRAFDLDEVVSVHGGLTFEGRCGEVICHTPAAGESDDVWWVGFDCSHNGDYYPGRGVGAEKIIRRQWFGQGEEYRDLAFVRRETERLAEQLAAMVPK